MARARIAVRLTRNFEQNLAAIESWDAEVRSPQAYDALLEALATSVIPTLERYPRIGRPFLQQTAQSIEAQDRIRAIEARTDAGELREYVCGDCLILYALTANTVHLLAIKHHRQLSFDLEAHWLSL